MSGKPVTLESGSTIEAFHGTSVAAGLSILLGGFKTSEGSKHWLGEGVYFYEGSWEHAYNWALKVKHLPPKDIVVVRALIALGHCLDFHRPECTDLVEKYFNEAENKIYKNNLRSKRYADEQIRVTEATVIDLIGRDTQIDTVRTSFSLSRKPIFPDSRFTKGQQIIICVRNLGNISDVEKA